MAKNKKTPKQKVSEFVLLVDNMMRCEYTTKQLITIRNQINRLEKIENLPTKNAKTQPINNTSESPEKLNEKPTDNLCKILGWKENTEYIVNNIRYKIVKNILYYNDPILNVWWENRGQLSEIDKFCNAEEIHDIYYLYNGELKQYGYLNVAYFQEKEEKILFDGNKQIYGIRNIFNKSECEYLQNKYQVAKICNMIPVEK